VYGVFIVITIVGLGSLSLRFPQTLIDGSPMSRYLCGFIAVFWLVRLVIQLFVFDMKLVLNTRLLRSGYHVLTLVFIYFVLVYRLGAFCPT